MWSFVPLLNFHMHIENHHGLSKCQVRLFTSSIHALVYRRLINVVVLCHELQHIVALGLIHSDSNNVVLQIAKINLDCFHITFKVIHPVA